jgi:hypothetical protein
VELMVQQAEPRAKRQQVLLVQAVRGNLD